jgi:hypothetical protein
MAKQEQQLETGASYIASSFDKLQKDSTAPLQQEQIQNFLPELSCLAASFDRLQRQIIALQQATTVDTPGRGAADLDIDKVGDAMVGPNPNTAEQATAKKTRTKTSRKASQKDYGKETRRATSKKELSGDTDFPPHIDWIPADNESSLFTTSIMGLQAHGMLHGVGTVEEAAQRCEDAAVWFTGASAAGWEVLDNADRCRFSRYIQPGYMYIKHTPSLTQAEGQASKHEADAVDDGLEQAAAVGGDAVATSWPDMTASSDGTVIKLITIDITPMLNGCCSMEQAVRKLQDYAEWFRRKSADGGEVIVFRGSHGGSICQWGPKKQAVSPARNKEEIAKGE